MGIIDPILTQLSLLIETENLATRILKLQLLLTPNSDMQNFYHNQIRKDF